MMKKTMAVIAALAAVTGSAMAADHYTVNQYNLIDRTGTLTAESRAEIGRIAVPFLGVNMHKDRVEQAEDVVEQYLDSVFGKDVYEVDLADVTVNNTMDMYIERGDNYDRRGTLTVNQAPETVTGNVYELVDDSGKLTAEDRAVITDILNRYTHGEMTSEKLADVAEDAVDHYLDNQYPGDLYDADMIYLAPGKWQLKVLSEVSSTGKKAAVNGVIYQLTDFTGALQAEDRAAITEILGRFTHGTGAVSKLAEHAEDAVEHYLDGKYGKDVYDVDMKDLPDGNYDVQIKHD